MVAQGHKQGKIMVSSRVLWVIFFFFVHLYFSHVLEASTEHHYINGKVEAVGNGTIKVSGVTYKIVPNVQVLKHVQYHGSFYEQPAKLSEILPGRSVSMKVLAGNVYEVIIEEYKK